MFIKDYGELTFMQSSEYGGDSTCSWHIFFNDRNEHTVKEFIDEILKSRDFDWGSVDIVVGDRRYWEAVEYKYGKIVKCEEEIFNQFINEKVIDIHANGGWNCMNYVVKI